MRDLMEKYGWDVPYIPMNVKNSEGKQDKLFADDNYVAELKRDGSRYTSIEGRFFSRKKSENKKTPELLGLPVEKTANVPHLAQFFAQFEGTVVEGEIFYPGKKSNHVTSIMGCDPYKAQERQMGEYGLIHYCLFEMTYANGEDLRDKPWEDRRGYLEAWYELFVVGTPQEKFIHLSSVWEGEKAKRTLLKWAEENGEEGIMFKNRTSTYKCDKRPEHHWYRVKGKITADVVLMGYEPPERLYEGKELDNWGYWEDLNGHKFGASGKDEAYAYSAAADVPVYPVTKFYFHSLIGSIVFGLVKDGELQKAGTCSGMDEEVRETFTRDGDYYVGKVIEITAMERTEKGMFRHPVFERLRDDKSPMDCIWETEVEE